MIRPHAALLVLALAACSATSAHRTATAPADLVGRFQDDYGEHYQISSREWVQLPHGRLHIVTWNVAERFLIARNDSANRYDPGKWTRIDWMPLSGMPPYTWAFCLTAFNAPTADSARASAPANRSIPRTGCNGYPFSRMRSE